MTFALLTELYRAGARIEADGDRLQIEAPAGTIAPKQRQALAKHKPEPLDLLRDPLMASITAAIDGLPIAPLRVLAHMTRDDRDDDVRHGRIGPLTVRDYAKSLAVDYGADPEARS